MPLIIHGSSSANVSASVAKLLESAEKIDDYMADNEYYYPDDLNTASFNNLYNQGDSKASCCTTYVSWCLQDAGFTKQHVNHSNGLYDLLDGDSNWELIEASDESDMKPGDIGVFSHSNNPDDTYHSNIYAGDSRYWDAGSDEAIKGKGAIAHSMPTFIFRYKN